MSSNPKDEAKTKRKARNRRPFSFYSLLGILELTPEDEEEVFDMNQKMEAQYDTTYLAYFEKKSFAKGEARGEARGKVEGETGLKLRMIPKLLLEGFSDKKIADMLELPLDQVQSEIRKNVN